MPIWAEDLGGPKNHVLDGVQISVWVGAILRRKESGLLQSIGTLCGELHPKPAEPIEMPFELRTRVGPRNHVLDGSTSLHEKG